MTGAGGVERNFDPRPKTGQSPPISPQRIPGVPDSAGRSGCVVPAGMLFVPPRLARLLVDLTAGAPAYFRRHGVPAPKAWTDWRSDLEDLADGVASSVTEPSEPSAWLNVGAVVEMFVDGGVPVSARTVTEWARTGKLRAKRDGQRAWLLASDDVEDEIEARASAVADRNRSGNRNSDTPTSWAS